MARILLITGIFPPAIGGPAVFSERLAQALTSKGHKVTVIAPGEGRDPVLRPYRVWRVPVANRYLYEILIRLVLIAGILTHRTVLLAGLELYAAPFARFLRRHYVVRVPGDIAWEQGRNWGIVTARFGEFQGMGSVPPVVAAIARKRNAALNFASRIVAPSDYLKKIIVGWGIDASRVTVIRNGVPLDGFSGAAPCERAGDLDVIFAGRLTNWKGVETLLLALSGVFGIRLEVIGEGPMLPSLMELARQLRLDVRFTPKMSQKDLHARMKAAHVFALPSDYEGLSHALQEAGAAGCARLASRIDGNNEAIAHGANGLLIPYGDVAAWREALVKLRDDDGLRLSLGHAAVASAARDDFRATVESYAALLEAQ